MDRHPLALDPEEMRTLGYRAIDVLVDRLSEWPESLLSGATRAEMSPVDVRLPD